MHDTNLGTEFFCTVEMRSGLWLFSARCVR